MEIRSIRKSFKARSFPALLWVFIAFTAFSACAHNPPKKERNEAELAFRRASPAEKCATLRYSSAERALLKARQLTTEGDYEQARRYFIVARDLSKKALKEARANEECMNPRPSSEETTEEPPLAPVGTFSPTEDPNYELQRIHFPFNSDEITAESREMLRRNAEWMNNFPGVRVRVEGHCDERGSTEYNLSLGERRANSVKQYLIMLSVSPDSLLNISYGEERPLKDGRNEEAWAENRRAEFRKLNQQ